jgi:threonine synthase
MLEAQKLLAASEGIFIQPESAATLAAYLKLKEKFSGSSVLIFTGHGLKASQQPPLNRKRHYQVTLDELPEVFRKFFE